MAHYLKLVPQSLKNRIVRQVTNMLKEQRLLAEATFPKAELSEKHISNLRVLTNREALLEQLPKGGNIAELGVNQGDFSQKILETCRPAHLHLVDAWHTPRYGEDKAQEVLQKFGSQIAAGKVQLHRGLSTERAADFADNYFDWVYIDTNHRYQTTYEELRAYAPKMKHGGIIAGHDFINGNWISGLRYGVREAVHEFCVEEGWEFVFLTMEIGDNPSFGIKKIGK